MTSDDQQDQKLVPLEVKIYANVYYAVRLGSPDFSPKEKEIPAKDLKQVFVKHSDAELAFMIRFLERFRVRVPGEELLGRRRNYSPCFIMGVEVPWQEIPDAEKDIFDLHIGRKDGDEISRYVLTRAGTYRKLEKNETLISFDDIGGIEALTL